MKDYRSVPLKRERPIAPDSPPLKASGALIAVPVLAVPMGGLLGIVTERRSAARFEHVGGAEDRCSRSRALGNPWFGCGRNLITSFQSDIYTTSAAQGLLPLLWFAVAVTDRVCFAAFCFAAGIASRGMRGARVGVGLDAADDGAARAYQSGRHDRDRNSAKSLEHVTNVAERRARLASCTGVVLLGRPSVGDREGARANHPADATCYGCEVIE
jgi:hypothetical protein